MAVICPDGHSHGVARLTRDPGRLRGAPMARREQAVELLGGAG